MKSLQDRFWSKVDQSKGLFDCWLWTASCSTKGYGWFCLAGRQLHAHRVAYELAIGPIPSGFCVLHHCDNPPCVNPAHLWLGTQADNGCDMDAKGRRFLPKGEHNGSAKLTERDVLAIRSDEGIYRAIAVFYGVHHETISRVKNRKSWRHI